MICPAGPTHPSDRSRVGPQPDTLPRSNDFLTTRDLTRSQELRTIRLDRLVHWGEEMRPDGEWQLQTAKARFSELFELARSVGPQRVTRRGKEAVIVMSLEEYERLTYRRRMPKNLYELISNSPMKGANLDLERATDTGRDVDL